MALPILPSTTDLRSITERGNVLIKDYNREDKRVPLYALDTGSATAYAIAPIPGIEQYVVGQIITFKAANANSGTAPTLNVNGLGAGTISFNGAALVANDIAANGMTMVQVASTTPTFHLLNPLLSPVPVTNTGATTFLAADVALNNTANYIAGPNTGSIGANGWSIAISAAGSVVDTAGAASIDLAITNGTVNVTAPFVNSRVTTPGANFVCPVVLPPVVVALSGATTFTLEARDISSTSGKLQTTAASGASNVSTYITWVRLA